MNYKADYHVHTTISPDAVDDGIQVIKSAVENGINEVCFTNHADVANIIKMPGDDMDFTYKTELALKEYKKCLNYIEENNLNIKLKYGIELGEPMQNEKTARQILDDNKEYLDFVLGSLHNLNNYYDFYSIDYSKENLDNLFVRYLDELNEHITFDNYDVLGHITYPLRYINGTHNLGFDIIKYNGDIYDIFKKLVKQNKGIEINTSGLRDNYGKTLPHLELVKIYKDAGGEIITIGSDSHNKNHVGCGITEGIDIANQAGFNYITTFTKRKPIMIKIDK